MPRMVKNGSGTVCIPTLSAAVALCINLGRLLAYRAIGLDGVAVKIVGTHTDEVASVAALHLTGVCEGRTFDNGKLAGRGRVVYVDSLGCLNVDIGHGSGSGCLRGRFRGLDLGEGWHCREESQIGNEIESLARAIH